ncbi:uncharacterized protein B0I36DRAFT_242604 [Microdochium trichocladiopsis]|uniref:ER transporter 6TM N-terminal domain-containing protein n=1 Tax=Microdochium trichocladiopsis TaxID=1682393 RepID=A0A9P8Y798_9PEZI|nr:uncharacterized protein B0I36DRAFT_242604 [Microdochium trichocladiopsis]KAH7031257.1 hypothetical protein B0I36DRAFT_242604 [Microdochium trichocladiopsis]
MAGIKANLMRNNLWQSILKNSLATTITLIIGIIPAIVAVYGHLTYLGAMVSVFAPPGQRFGQMAEALILVLVGAMSGVAWGMLGLFLSELVLESNISAAYGIRAVFFALAVLGHGILRASTPRLFLAVFWLLLMSLVILTSSSMGVSLAILTELAYPILTATAVIVLVNILIYPSFSNGLLGHSTINMLHETLKSLADANEWFFSSLVGLDSKEKQVQVVSDLRTRLALLSERKTKLKAQLAASQKQQAECNFELAYTFLPPRSLKPINGALMTRFVKATIALIGACESKYSMIGEQYMENDDRSDAPSEAISDDDSDSDADSETSSSDIDIDSDSSDDEKSVKQGVRKSKHVRKIELVRPVREVEGGDITLLEHLIFQVRAPILALQAEMEQAVQVVTSVLAFCFDVSTLPPSHVKPYGIIAAELDVRTEIFVRALAQFDQESATALSQAATTVYKKEYKGDVMPRMETHLVSSLLINQRQAGSQLLSILQHGRALVDARTACHNRRRFYLPRISWRKWLRTGGERDVNVLPENARKEARAGHGVLEDRRNSVGEDGHSQSSNEDLLDSHEDEEACNIRPVPTVSTEVGTIPRRKGPQKADSSTIPWLRGIAADVIEFIADSDSLSFALKLSVAAFSVTWPAFVPSLNAWYSSVRGSWATLQLILVFEVSVGTSFQGFFLRAVGTIVGCTIGYLAYCIGGGNEVVAIVVLVIGLVPSSYVQVATPYVKTGVISITSLAVICLSIIAGGFSDPPWEIYVKRMACFLVGGTAALFVELFLFPARARDRLVESLASCIQQISQMENSIAVGIDSPINIDVRNHAHNTNFSDAKGKADQALAAARTFLPFCLTEPRLKGSFTGQTIIYGEMIYVLSQIIDRMDNMLSLRQAFGSGVLEELNKDVASYRRNVAGSISIALFAVHEALTTRLPLPQFLPSSRNAQLRYISRVRELLLQRSSEGLESKNPTRRGSLVMPTQALKSATKQNFISWNAASAGMMEIIEYVEELIDLAKLLVGVNAFRSGMLERPNFHDYIAKGDATKGVNISGVPSMSEISLRMSRTHSGGLHKRRSWASKVRPEPESRGKTRSRGFSLGSYGGHGAADGPYPDDEELDLPMSLQRVKTKRMEGLERLRSAGTHDPKGKGLRSTRTWAA